MTLAQSVESARTGECLCAPTGCICVSPDMSAEDMSACMSALTDAKRQADDATARNDSADAARWGAERSRLAVKLREACEASPYVNLAARKLAYREDAVRFDRAVAIASLQRLEIALPEGKTWETVSEPFLRAAADALANPNRRPAPYAPPARDPRIDYRLDAAPHSIKLKKYLAGPTFNAFRRFIRVDAIEELTRIWNRYRGVPFAEKQLAELKQRSDAFVRTRWEAVLDTQEPVWRADALRYTVKRAGARVRSAAAWRNQARHDSAGATPAAPSTKVQWPTGYDRDAAMKILYACGLAVSAEPDDAVLLAMLLAMITVITTPTPTNDDTADEDPGVDDGFMTKNDADDSPRRGVQYPFRPANNDAYDLYDAYEPAAPAYVPNTVRETVEGAYTKPDAKAQAHEVAAAYLAGAE